MGLLSTGRKNAGFPRKPEKQKTGKRRIKEFHKSSEYAETDNITLPRQGLHVA